MRYKVVGTLYADGAESFFKSPHEVPKTMKLTAKTLKWFNVPGDADGAKVQILHLKPGEIQRIESGTSEWNGRLVGEEFLSELKYNPAKQLRNLRMAALVDWKGFFDEDGEPLKCSTKSKDLYFDEDPVLTDDGKRFSELIDGFRAELAESLRPQEEQAEGN